jgi:hypothetical protein
VVGSYAFDFIHSSTFEMFIRGGRLFMTGDDVAVPALGQSNFFGLDFLLSFLFSP